MDNFRSYINIPSSNSSKSFLSRCIPYLKINNFITNLNGFDFKINTNSRGIGRLEGITHKGLQQATFTTTGITDEDHFELREKEEQREERIGKR
jgi:hypothetical protein